MSLKNRIAKLEEHLSPPEDAGERIIARWAEQSRHEQEEFLAHHIPEDLRDAVRAAFRGPGEDTFASWRLWPFADWAMPMPAGFAFPRALVEWMLDPPRPFFMGHSCERCGLCVPLLSTWSNDPDPPPDLSVFAACPSCGGRTTFAACYQRGSREPE